MSCPFGSGANEGAKRDGAVYYSAYLQLDKILDAQTPLSTDEKGECAHEEMLFIIIHQSYELWFKQVLFEVNSIHKVFSNEVVNEKDVAIASSRLNRVLEIMKIMVDKIRILETMTPLDFLDFRDKLVPASGFQSYQFRLLENKLGLRPEVRLKYQKTAYSGHLTQEHRELVEGAEKQDSLYQLIEKWLERTPFVDFEVKDMFEENKKSVGASPHLSEEERENEVKLLDETHASFQALLDEDKHNALIEKGQRTLSHKATKAALLINLYRDEPILNKPFTLLTQLIELDEMLVLWRYRHALMVQRMIGAKSGSGGSSGYQYLRATASRHWIFTDFSALSTFLLPRSKMPKIPEDLVKKLGFHYDPSQ